MDPDTSMLMLNKHNSQANQSSSFSPLYRTEIPHFDDGASSQNSYSNFRLKIRKILEKENSKSVEGPSVHCMKIKEVIKTQAVKFVSLHKDAKSQIGELQTLLIKKDCVHDEDLEKRRYYDQIVSHQSECVRFFNLKNHEKTMQSLASLEQLSSNAYDVKVLNTVL